MGSTEHTLHHWANSVSATPLSRWMQDQLWIVPTSQSIHIVAMAVIFGCAITIDLRLLGLSRTGRPISLLTRSLVPWIYGSLVVSLITGVIQTIIEPLRQFVTPAYWAKMLMIVLVFSLTVWFDRSVRRDPVRWDARPSRPRSAWAFALLSLLLWVGIIACGRFIAYTWEQYA